MSGKQENRPNEKGGAESPERQLEREALTARMCRIKRKVIVLSGKGGVGKSTVAVNLAVAAARSGVKTGLLDVDVHGPSVPKLLGLEGTHPDVSAGSIKPIEAADNLVVMSVGFLLSGADDAVIWRGPMKYTVIRQFLADVDWGDLGLLVVDSPPGTGDEPLSVIQLIENADGAIIVTTPQDLATADVRRSINFCRQLELPVLGVVENMSGFACPKCGEVTDVFGSGGGEKMAGEMGVPFLGRVPIDRQVCRSGEAGTPYAGLENSPAAAVFHAAAECAAGKGAEKKEDNAMRYAVPLVNGTLSAHFGHCEEFAFIDVDAETNDVTSVTKATPPPHEPGVLPEWLSGKGVKIIIAGGMGRRAQGLFAQSGIKVLVGAPEAAPEEIVRAYLDGTLELGTNICDH